MDFERNARIMGRFCKYGTIINSLDSEQSLLLASCLPYKAPAALQCTGGPWIQGRGLRLRRFLASLHACFIPLRVLP